MPRPKGSENRSRRGAVNTWPQPGLTLEELVAKEAHKLAISQIDQEVLAGMSSTNHNRLTRMDPAKLSMRQRQTAGAEYLAGLVGHPAMRKRIAEEGLKDPMTILKIASSERPKELHVEGEIRHSVVVVPTQLTAEAWDAQIKTIEGELVNEEKPW